MRHGSRSLSLAAAVAVGLLACCPLPAARPRENPDVTRGGTIPVGASHDWTLGATRARGWMYCEMLVTTQARLTELSE